jgi:TnsA endonuclease N terminal/TnsA endonuclease C terminal
LPVRKVHHGNRNITGLVVNTEAQIGDAFESTLERDLMLICRFDIHVLKVEPQPVSIPFLDETGQTHSYTPDLLVHYRKDFNAAREMKSELIEVKYSDDLKKHAEEYAPKFAAAKAFALERGWVFKVLTELEIRTPYLENARFLFPYHKVPAVDEVRVKLLSQLRELRKTTPDALVSSIYRDSMNQARLLPMLWQLIADYQIGTDLTLKLTMNSEIWSLKI